MNLDGKAALVTGGSRGVGRATVLALARAGCAVAVNYSRSKSAAETVVGEAKAIGAKVFAYQADVADDDACRAMMQTAAKDLGRIDILVNNAGTTEFIAHTELDKLTDALWDRILAVNVKGPFHCVRAAQPHLEAAGGGEIINITSVAGLTGAGSSIPYCASKAALINMTSSLARALGPRIRVNSIAPGFIVSEWTRTGLGDNYETTKQAAEAKAVLDRVCLPEDVADAILAVITGSDMVTGQTIVCDGGGLLGPR